MEMESSMTSLSFSYASKASSTLLFFFSTRTSKTTPSSSERTPLATIICTTCILSDWEKTLPPAAPSSLRSSLWPGPAPTRPSASSAAASKLSEKVRSSMPSSSLFTFSLLIPPSSSSSSSLSLGASWMTPSGPRAKLLCRLSYGPCCSSLLQMRMQVSTRSSRAVSLCSLSFSSEESLSPSMAVSMSLYTSKAARHLGSPFSASFSRTALSATLARPASCSITMRWERVLG
mmetsp:Transcript_25082/g.49977  ORF Transcript_25082/g.49977 Transcript_25082/m.49977 type:complete len:232 (-) Transcript_25082:2269-2964(-)